ncbi:glycosyltransferase [Flavobacterium capsici]|uniref:Glycosyltransferase n=1 Tax=Flavobacterium capsici TaxID=3075618 RepID=A0AA96J8V5_9FLAO|nr:MULTISPECIES: glycosyltransferase [unclassified Flavobacterium]WNM18750.1 glycosyltransferase [Flavobacterium sp. PMR2A8]WNM22801.1 glycosyltransferase [Flavobacterium sp. PMTSA4]
MNTNHKIAIVSSSLGVGGAEKFASLLSFMLNSIGYEIHNIIINDFVVYDYKGTLVNLGEIFSESKGVFRSLKKGKHIANYLKENNIKIVIDNRSRPTISRELFTKWVYGSANKYYFFHSSNLEMYLTSSVFWAKKIFSDATKLICVSKNIEDVLKAKYNFRNTITLYNPVVFEDKVYEKPTNLPEKYFLFFGRFEENVKNFSLMLESFAKSNSFQSGYDLVLIGDGSSKDYIISKSKTLQIENHVHILPFQKDIKPFIQHAFATLLTSHFEGFPMSIIESLAVGTPVVSVDCESGPKEIVVNKSNGLLVDNHNVDAFGEAIKLLIDDQNLYQNCKNNAKKSVEHLSLENITQQWEQLLENT